jgi:hypothetical protein
MKPFHAAAAFSVILTIAVMSIISTAVAGSNDAAPASARAGVSVATPPPGLTPVFPQPAQAQAVIPPKGVSFPAQSNFAIDAQRESHFVWPAQGNLTSYFGPGHPLGIDIGLDPSVDTPITASAAGIVQFAGGDPCCVYGLHVIIAHDGNRSTLYGHLSRISVREGQRVSQGDLLGLGGATGEATGKHLHFELHEGETLVDPLRYLPAEQGSGEPYALGQDCGTAPILVDPDSRVTLDFPYAPAGYKVVDAQVQNSEGDQDFTAYLQTRSGASPRVSLVIPPAAAARGHIEDSVLEVTLSDGSNRKIVDCQVSLNTMRTLPNIIAQKSQTGLNSPLKNATPGSPTPVPSKYLPPTATPTKTPVGGVKTPVASTTVTTTTLANSTDLKASANLPAATPKPATPPPTPRPLPTPKPVTHFPITH